jgi:hypothetical protein
MAAPSVAGRHPVEPGLVELEQPLPEFHQRVQVLNVADGTPGVDAPEE